MQSKLHDIELEALLEALPTPLVVLDARSEDPIYANEAARKLPFAYTDAPGWVASGADGERIAPEHLPHREALHGTPCQRRVIHFTRGDVDHSLLFHCNHLEGGLVLLTFEDLSLVDAAQKQLRDALQARDELVSMAAHELRSPLGALQLVAERLARKAGEMAPEELRKLAETAKRQTTRLNILVSNLLDVSRMRSGKFELELETGALGDIVREACEALEEQARAENIELTVHIQDACIGMWDHVRMEQVVVNLVTNALKYGNHTPVRVVLERPGANGVSLRVEDGGLGIPDEARERIFEPFARASRTHKAQSLGLGLYIVRTIARAHGGDVRLETSPGHTTFIITLPIR